MIYWKHQTNECNIRYSIIREVFKKYSDLKVNLKKDDPLYYDKKNLYKPRELFTFYCIFLPTYIFNGNLIFLYAFRKNFSTMKYFSLFCFNYFSLYICFLVMDKKVFENYLQKINPYSKFMREEFLKHKEEISEKSYLKIMEYNRKAKELYEF